MPHRLRRSQLIEFPNAAAGHPGVLADKSGAMFVKPCKQAEIDFYESCAAHPEFQYYIPRFYGKLTLNQDAAGTPTAALSRPAHAHSSSQSGLLEPASAKVTIPVAEASWTPSDGRQISAEGAAVMENITNGFSKPNVLDVKLGARLWADDAPSAKRQKLDKVSDETTSRHLGFRIAGMKVWTGIPAGKEDVTGNGYKKYDKLYGRNLKVERVHDGFRDYFLVESAGTPQKLANKVINRFLMDLRGLVEVLEREESRMYSSSLLFVYEGDGQALAEKFAAEKSLMESHPYLSEEATNDGGIVPIIETKADPDENGIEDGMSSSDEDIQLPDIQAVKMIDFAHAEWTPGQGPDENVLHGIRCVIKILEDLLE